MDYSMIGPALVLGLACAGSAIGCGIAGMASHGVMSRTDQNHGPFIAMSAMPSSQSIYGLVLMLLMLPKLKDVVDPVTKAVTPASLDAFNAMGIGLCVGIALLISAIYQGKCAATGIQASAKQPKIIGKCFVALGIVESFSLFSFVFGLMLI